MRAFLIVMGLLLVAALVILPLLVIVKPVVTEALRARAAGNAWLPFLPDANGTYGPLSANRWWAVFRVESPQAGGLVWRWAFWAVMGSALTVACLFLCWRAIQLISRVWA